MLTGESERTRHHWKDLSNKQESGKGISGQAGRHQRRASSTTVTQIRLFNECPSEVGPLTLHRGDQMPSEHNRITEADEGETRDDGRNVVRVISHRKQEPQQHSSTPGQVQHEALH